MKTVRITKTVRTEAEKTELYKQLHELYLNHGLRGTYGYSTRRERGETSQIHQWQFQILTLNDEEFVVMRSGRGFTIHFNNVGRILKNGRGRRELQLGEQIRESYSAMMEERYSDHKGNKQAIEAAEKQWEVVANGDEES